MARLLTIIKSKYFWLFALAAFNLLIAFYFLKLPLWSSDSETYWQAARFLQGEKIEPIPFNRLLTTPLMLYASLFFSFFSGSFFSGMLTVNLIFYFLIIYIFYKLIYEIYRDERAAFYGTALFLANYSMYNFGVGYVTDLGGWFFFILGSFLALKYYYTNSKKFYCLAVAAAGIGVLFKEYGALGIISLSLLILAADYPLAKKIKEIALAGLLFSLIPILYNIIFYLKFNYSYLDWYGYAADAFAPRYNLALLIKVLGWVYLAGWPIFIYGLWQEKKYFSKKRALVLSALLPASLSFLAWPALTQRIAFIIVPWLALISGFGLSKIKNNYLIGAILIAYTVVNYSITSFLIKIINLPF